MQLTDTFIKHDLFIKRFLKNYLKRDQDIEDITQEVFIRAMHASDQKNEISQPKAFLFTIAKNLALNEIARKSNQTTDYIEDCMPEMENYGCNGLEFEFDKRQRMEIYQEALGLLSEKCKQVFLLRKVYSFSHKEIAQELGISISSVEKYLREAILVCKRHLETYENKQTFKRSYYQADPVSSL